MTKKEITREVITTALGFIMVMVGVSALMAGIYLLGGN